MTLSSTAVYQQFNGNGSTTNFSVTAFQWWEIEVTHIAADGTETAWVEGSDYSLLDEDASPMTGGDGRKGTVVADVAPASGTKLRVWRVTDRTQEVEFVENDNFPSATMEDSLDRLVMLVQELETDIKRGAKLSKADHVALSGTALTLPTPDAGKLMVWNDDEDGFDNVAAADIDLAVVTPFIETLLDDANAATARTTLGLGSGDSPTFVNETLTGYLDLTEIAEPASPASNVARLRALDDGAGVTTVGFKNSAGGIVPMSHFKQSGTGAVTRSAEARFRDAIYAADFGVVADNVNDDTAEMQAAINAAIASNRPLLLPIGSIKTSAALTINAPICMTGCGHVMTVFKPTSTTANVFTIDCIEPVELKDFGIDASDITPTDGAGIYVTNTASSRNLESQFTGLRVLGTFYGIVFDRAAYWTMDRCFVASCLDAHVVVRNLFDDDEGDSCITNCLFSFFDVPTSANILLFQASSGGLKITGTKFLGGYHGYHLGLADGAQTLGPTIAGNSFENQTAASIFMGADNDATSLIARTVITGNEIAPYGNGHGIQIGGSATSGWCRGVTIAGNNITVDLNAAAASSANGILVAFATDIAIVGNVMKNDGAAGTTVGITLGGGVTRVTKGLNIINGYATAISDGSTSPQTETSAFYSSGSKLDWASGDVTITHSSNLLTFAGATSGYTFNEIVTNLDTYRCQGVNPGFWLDETDGGVKGAYVVLDGGDLAIQRRATAFGAFEANLATLNLTTGNLTTIGIMKPMVTTVASLPAAGTAGAGARAFVTNANATTFASVVAGGGANGVPVYSDGTNWRIG